MYDRSRTISTFHIAGFQYADGALVLDRLKAGMSLQMEAEPDNPYDPNAVVIRWGGVKLGYVPRAENGFLSAALWFGHTGLFELRVLQVSPERSPYHQVRVGLLIADARPVAAVTAPGPEGFAPAGDGPDAPARSGEEGPAIGEVAEKGPRGLFRDALMHFHPASGE